MCACSRSGLSATVLRISCLIAAIVASVASKLFHHLSTIVELVVCFSIFVVLVLLLKYLLLDPFSTPHGLLCHHSLLQFLNPSRCSAQSHLSLLPAVADGHPNFLALDHHELLHVLTSSLSSLVLETSLFWVFPLDGLGGSPGLTVAFQKHLCTSLECVSRQSLHFSMITCLVAVWNASHHSGPDATLRRQQQGVHFDLSTRPTQTALTQALSNLPALILSASAIFAMTTSPNGTIADSYRQPLVLFDRTGSAPPSQTECRNIHGNNCVPGMILTFI